MREPMTLAEEKEWREILKQLTDDQKERLSTLARSLRDEPDETKSKT